jgi:crotonobetainyl-CoA:carnitine CoA-transferase CaiB-like acyl-CoA transferase
MAVIVNLRCEVIKPCGRAPVATGRNGERHVTNAKAFSAQPAGPLGGIRVIDVTTVVLGPFCTQTLGDMGADVIKVEPPEGDSTRGIGPSRTPGMGSYFANLNRNKRSIVLDLKRPAGKAALLRLVETADVFVHNMRLGAAQRLGLDYAKLSEVSPNLIYASASGFRKGSKQQQVPAFDDLIQGVSGTAALNAGPDGAPRYFPSVLIDKLTGAQLASAIGMALFHRQRSGVGQEVHLPMMETILSFLLVEHLWSGTLGEPEKGLGYPRMLTPYRRPYRTKDGFISVIAHTDAQWSKLFDAMGVPDYKDDPRFATLPARSANIDALYATLAEGMHVRTTDDWIATLSAADIPCGKVNRLEDLFADSYLTDTNYFEHLTHPDEGQVVVPAIPVQLSQTPGAVRRLWPKLGEHTQEILQEAGCSEAEIAAVTGI